jgi:hypothetical protein
MLMTNWMRRAAACACTAALLSAPVATFAETPIVTTESRAAAAATDVVLGPKGTLLGLVKDIAGKAKGHALVTVGYSGSEVAAVETLDDGSFAVEGLREGTHVIQSGGEKSTFRFWEADKAPPNAKPDITLVARSAAGPDRAGAAEIFAAPRVFRAGLRQLSDSDRCWPAGGWHRIGYRDWIGNQ